MDCRLKFLIGTIVKTSKLSMRQGLGVECRYMALSTQEAKIRRGQELIGAEKFAWSVVNQAILNLYKNSLLASFVDPSRFSFYGRMGNTII